MDKPTNNRAWLFLVPVLCVVAFSAVIPLMTVVNYSVQDILGPEQHVFVAWEWYKKVLHDPELHGALLRQIIFSLSVLLIELPLGLAVARAMPKAGLSASLTLVILALPLARADIGLGGALVNAAGVDYNYTAHSSDAWITVLLMDVWHWTPLVALLCYAGLRAIPEAYYQAARIDGASAWATFRYIELPKLRGVLTIAVLLRFMDSFMIYTEPFVLTGGGPGNATTFLSQYLTRLAVGQFDLGPAAAFSIVYFLVILLLSYIFYTAMSAADQTRRSQ
jgi:glycerol transport system permease protein